MSSNRRRERRLALAGDVWTDDVDPGLFFDDRGPSRRRTWKLQQLCKQVERAASVTLAGECGSDALLGAAVLSVEPAPDAARLRVTVALAPGRALEDAARAIADLRRAGPAFRQETARSIHRKRVPEVTFDVRLAGEVDHE
ncbi:MAG TPA: ribosome-binding factor A [Vicinamibacteria bacterium]